MRRRLTVNAPAGFLALALLLGGSSADGAWANAALQFTALCVIVATPLVFRPAQLVPAERVLLLLAVAITAIAAFQLVPLPPWLWVRLSGRTELLAGYRMLDADLPWLALSFWPRATMASALSMLPPVAMALLVYASGRNGIMRIAWALGTVAIVSFLAGFVQLAGGYNSVFYLYSITNRGQSVGLFANSNHLATLGVMTLPFLAALGARDADRTAINSNSGRWVMLAAAFVLVVLGVVVDGSVAGLALLIPSLGGAVVIFNGGRTHVATWIALGLVAIVTVAFLGIALLSPLATGFANTDLGTGVQSRSDIYSHSWVALKAVWPMDPDSALLQPITRDSKMSPR